METLPKLFWNKILRFNQWISCIYLHAIVSFYFAACLLNSWDIFVSFPQCGIGGELSFRAISLFLPHPKKIPPALSLYITTLPMAEIGMLGDRKCVCECVVHSYIQMNMTLSLNLKPLLWISTFLTWHNSVPQLIAKIHLQRELKFSLWGLKLPVYQFVLTGMNPAVVLPKNKTFAAQGVVGSSACKGAREGEDFQRERQQLKIQY